MKERFTSSDNINRNICNDNICSSECSSSQIHSLTTNKITYPTFLRSLSETDEADPRFGFLSLLLLFLELPAMLLELESELLSSLLLLDSELEELSEVDDELL